ncbi:MAG: hypothetical protein AB7F67_13770 [Rhodospirillaceae bacterium]
MRRAVVLAAAALAVAPPPPAGAQALTHDFSFGRGAPFAGSVSIGGVCVTLATANTEPYGRTAFRDRMNTDPAQVTLTFSATISGFQLDVSRVRADELLTDFSIGEPTMLVSRDGGHKHSLVSREGRITTTSDGDYGQGRMLWTGLHTDTVRFTIWNTPRARNLPALAVDAFGFVPLGPVTGSPPSCPPAADAGDAAGKPSGAAGDAAGPRRKLPIRNSERWGVCGDAC